MTIGITLFKTALLIPSLMESEKFIVGYCLAKFFNRTDLMNVSFTAFFGSNNCFKATIDNSLTLRSRSLLYFGLACIIHEKIEKKPESFMPS